MANTPYPQSYYAASANPVPERPPLQDDVETDVCVIGAGYTGLSSALFLLENGFRVTVLEAAKVGFGASGRNGGQIVNSYSRDIDVIERSVGAKQAQLLGQMAFEGGRIIRERVAKYNIQCDLKDGGVFAALSNKQMGHLESQKKLWERFGHTQLELLDQRRIREVVNCDQYVGGMLDMSGGARRQPSSRWVARSTNSRRPCVSSAVPIRWSTRPRARSGPSSSSSRATPISATWCRNWPPSPCRAGPR